MQEPSPECRQSILLAAAALHCSRHDRGGSASCTNMLLQMSHHGGSVCKLAHKCRVSSGAAGACCSSHLLLPQDMLLDIASTGFARYFDKPSKQMLINLGKPPFRLPYSRFIISVASMWAVSISQMGACHQRLSSFPGQNVRIHSSSSCSLAGCPGNRRPYPAAQRLGSCECAPASVRSVAASRQSTAAGLPGNQPCQPGGLCSHRAAPDQRSRDTS